MKKEIDEIIEKNELRIFILIDDLDRLTPDQTLEVFQLIKLNANFKNTSYIVAYDKAIVTDIVEKRYNQKGANYLDKIIQVDYVIPEILNEKIEDIFFQELSDFLKHYNINYDIKEMYDCWLYYDLRFFFRTLRDVYRYINSLHFRLPGIYKEINITDFLIIEAIRIFDYQNYANIYIAKNGKLIKDVPYIDNSISQKLYSYLFDSDLSRILKTDKNINNKQYFETYFALKLSSIDISEDEFKQVINNSSNRLDLFNSISKNGRFNNLLRRLTNPNLQNHQKVDISICRDLIEFFDNNQRRIDQYGFDAWEAALNITLSSDDKIKELEFLFKLLLELSGKASPTRFYFLYLLLLNIENDFKYGLLDYQDLVLKYKDKFVEYFQNFLRSWNYYFIPDLASTSFKMSKVFLIKYSEYYEKDYKKIIISNFEDEQKLITIIKFLSVLNQETGTAHSLDFEFKDRILPEEIYNQFCEKVSEIKLDLISSEDQKYVALFQNFLRTGEGVSITIN